MATGYEVAYYHHIEQIARSLDRIANVMEAQEKRMERTTREVYPPEVIRAVESLMRGFDDLENAVQGEGEGKMRPGPDGWEEGGNGGDRPAGA